MTHATFIQKIKQKAKVLGIKVITIKKNQCPLCEMDMGKDYQAAKKILNPKE